MSENKEADKKESKTGRYVYDKKLGRVVKVSDEIVGIKKSSAPAERSCPMKPGGHSCNGCCGHGA